MNKYREELPITMVVWVLLLIAALFAPFATYVSGSTSWMATLVLDWVALVAYEALVVVFVMLVAETSAYLRLSIQARGTQRRDFRWLRYVLGQVIVLLVCIVVLVLRK